MPRHRPRIEIRMSRTARCPPSALMGRIGDPATWPSWQSEIDSATGPPSLSAGDVVQGRATLLGFDVDGRSEMVDVTGERLEEDVIVGVRMRVRYEVTPHANGAVVTRTLTADLPGGASGRLLSFLLRWRLTRMQTRLLDDLVAQAESAGD